MPVIMLVQTAVCVVSMPGYLSVWQLSRISDLFILSSLEGNPGHIHTAEARWTPERERKKENRKCLLREEGEIEKGSSGRERRTGYNLSHMADLKKAASLL